MKNLEAKINSVLFGAADLLDRGGEAAEAGAHVVAGELSALLFVAIKAGVVLPLSLLVRVGAVLIGALKLLAVLFAGETSDLREAWANYQDARSALRL